MTQISDALIEEAAGSLGAWGDWSAQLFAARAVLAAVADDLRADAWDEGYRHWYDNDVPPEDRSYGKGNPYRKEA